MIYAPIIITAFNRPVSLQRLLTSLSNNKYAQYTDIYVGLDYPKQDKQGESYLKVRELLKRDFTQFKSFQVIVRNKNFGHKKNLEDMIDRCAKEHDRWIVMGDDLEASPNFLTYMDTMLDQYVLDPSVMAVTGYSYPVAWRVKPECNAVKQSFTANDWGIGFWRDKYYTMFKYFRSNGLQKSFPEMYRSDFDGLTDWAITDYVNGVTYGLTPHSYFYGVFDVSLRIYLSVKHKYVIMPIVSHIRNWGFDGSGINCRKSVTDNSQKVISSNYNFSGQIIDEDEAYSVCLDGEFDNTENRALLNEFDFVPLEKMKSVMEQAERYGEHGENYRYWINTKHLLDKVVNKFRRR